MAVLTHDEQYPCAFDLRLLELERYTTDKGGLNVKTAGLGEPYTLGNQQGHILNINY